MAKGTFLPVCVDVESKESRCELEVCEREREEGEEEEEEGSEEEEEESENRDGKSMSEWNYVDYDKYKMTHSLTHSLTD